MKSSLRSLPLVVLAALLVGHVPSLPAQTIGGAPNTIDYQGKALDAQGAVLAPTTAANYEMTFRIYDAQEGGTIIWAEKQIVTVSKGLFSVRLGEGTATGEGAVLQTNLADAFNAASRFLGVTIAISGQTPVEILPRLAFLATPFAYSANRSVTAERLVLNPSANAVPSAVNASALSYATQTLTTGDFTLNENNHTLPPTRSPGGLILRCPPSPRGANTLSLRPTPRLTRSKYWHRAVARSRGLPRISLLLGPRAGARVAATASN